MTQKAVKVTVTHQFRASAERVFDAWLNPKKARKFMFATPAGQMVRAEMDPRVGGKFCFVDRRPDGDAEHFGEYLEIERPRRLVFAFAVEQDAKDFDRVTIEITPREVGCELTLTHELKPEWAEYKDRTAQGWTEMLKEIAEVLTSITQSPSHQIRLVREIGASAEAIYRAWTDLDLMRLWLATIVEADVRVGGKYRLEIHEKDGVINEFRGEYLALEPAKKISMTFQHQSEYGMASIDEFVMITLRPLGPFRTELTLVNGWDGMPSTPETEKGALEGWLEWLRMMEDALQKNL